MKTVSEKFETAPLPCFDSDQIRIVTDATEMAEELVSDYYKMSANQWLRSIYDIKTLADLTPDEIVQGPYAQIIRYEGKPKRAALGSTSFDFYKICLQDHTILSTLAGSTAIELSPFSLYIVTHELIHVVRFKKFLQNFSASPRETMIEEKRVHDTTRDILRKIRLSGLGEVLSFYHRWHSPIEDRRDT